jgi:hypothetical protein
MNQTEEAGFKIGFMKKDPKPNAPEYQITTIQELFDMLTPENIDRFFEEFSLSMKTCVLARQDLFDQVLKQIPAERVNEINIQAKDLYKMPSFKWIDD